MNEKEICTDLMQKGVEARWNSFRGIPSNEWKEKAPLYNRFVHGVRDVMYGLEIATEEEIMAIENKAASKAERSEVVNENVQSLVKLPAEDKLSTYTYKRQVRRAVISRAVGFLCGALVAYFLPICFK